ncbi:hypothetical protein U1Q18_045239 [Sarracenia purpurea var. burkii]
MRISEVKTGNRIGHHVPIPGSGMRDFPLLPHRSFSNPRSSISSTTEDQAILLADTPPLAVIATAEVAGFPLSADAYLPKGSPPTFLFSTR